jgi:transposase
VGPENPRQGRSSPAAATPAAGDLHPPARGPAPEGRPGRLHDKRYGHVTRRKGRTQFLAFCRYLRSLHPPAVRIPLVCDNFSPHLSTRTDSRVGIWAAANNVEIACTPFYGSWLNRIEPQFTALRYFALNGTDYASRREQARMIRRYIAWRNGYVTDPRLRKVVDGA